MWLAVGRLPMVAQSPGAEERLLAASARVGPLVRVQTFVQLEGGREAELLQTNVALMLF